MAMKPITELESFGAQEARLKLRDALDSALRGDPVVITRFGRPEGVIISPALYEKYLTTVDVTEPLE